MKVSGFDDRNFTDLSRNVQPPSSMIIMHYVLIYNNGVVSRVCLSVSFFWVNHVKSNWTSIYLLWLKLSVQYFRSDPLVGSSWRSLIVTSPLSSLNGSIFLNQYSIS